MAPLLGSVFDWIVGDHSALHSHTHYFFASSQRTSGRGHVLRGLLFDYPVRGYFSALSLLIVNSGITLGFLSAIAATLVIQGISILILRMERRKGYDCMSNLTDSSSLVRACTEPVLHFILPSAAPRSLCWKRNSPRGRNRQVERTCSHAL